MRVFCEECHDSVGYFIRSVSSTQQIKGKEIEFFEKIAYCDECGNEVFISEIRDENLKLLDDAYRKLEGLISIDQIQSILEKYNIGKRPLSELLGWGDVTITRYLDGTIPTKQYSDKLLQILDNPAAMLEVLEKNREHISSVAYNKCKEAVSKLEYESHISGSDKLNSVAQYILSITEDITALALQKLLYFSQGFNIAFNGTYLFEDDCEAWVHGPVYKEIYQKYKNYGYNPISSSKPEHSFYLCYNEMEVINSVMANFGCYSGKVLEKMTHSERPWISTRKDLPDTSPSNIIISKNLLEEYFAEIKEKYKMLNVYDIKDYSRDLFEKVVLY